MLWPVVRMTAWVFPTATMRSTDIRGLWRGPVLKLLRKTHVDEQAQGNVEVWWGWEREVSKAGVQIGCDTVRLRDASP